MECFVGLTASAVGILSSAWISIAGLSQVAEQQLRILNKVSTTSDSREILKTV